jgi:hypothetical protein
VQAQTNGTLPPAQPATRQPTNGRRRRTQLGNVLPASSVSLAGGNGGVRFGSVIVTRTGGCRVDVALHVLNASCSTVDDSIADSLAGYERAKVLADVAVRLGPKAYMDAWLWPW